MIFIFGFRWCFFFGMAIAIWISLRLDLMRFILAALHWCTWRESSTLMCTLRLERCSWLEWQVLLGMTGSSTSTKLVLVSVRLLLVFNVEKRNWNMTIFKLIWNILEKSISTCICSICLGMSSPKIMLMRELQGPLLLIDITVKSLI